MASHISCPGGRLLPPGHDLLVASRAGLPGNQHRHRPGVVGHGSQVVGDRLRGVLGRRTARGDRIGRESDEPEEPEQGGNDLSEPCDARQHNEVFLPLS